MYRSLPLVFAVGKAGRIVVPQRFQASVFPRHSRAATWRPGGNRSAFRQDDPSGDV
jgi:hypothetical protein